METNPQCIIESQGLCPQQAKYTAAAIVSGTVCTLGWDYPQFIILQCVTITAWLHHLQNNPLSYWMDYFWLIDAANSQTMKLPPEHGDAIVYLCLQQLVQYPC